MSIGKNSVARAAKATAKPAETAQEEVLEATAEALPEETAEEAVCEAPAEEKDTKIPEKFKKVQVGDGMPAFLL